MNPNAIINTLKSALQDLESNRLDMARKKLTKVLRHDAKNPHALHWLGMIEGKAGNLEKAASLLEKANAAKPMDPDILYNLATAKMKQEKFEEAERILTSLIKVHPAFVKAYTNLGHVLQNQNKLPEAETVLRQAIQIDRNNVLARMNAAAVLHLQNKYSEAANHLEYIAALQPDNADVFFRLGLVYKDAESYAKACECFRRSIELRIPALPEAYTNLAISLESLGQATEAIDAYTQSIHLNPEPQAYFNRAIAILQSGDLARGFQEYEWRANTEQYQPLFSRFSEATRWKGESFAGKRLLIHHEQGLGDTMQMIRYIPMVKARGGQVIVATRRQLLRLLDNVPGIDTVCEYTSINADEFDLTVPIMSLPAIMETTLQTIPAQIPYLFPDQHLVAQWKQTIGSDSKRKVGLVWAGNPHDTGGLYRTCGLEAMLPLTRVPGIDYYSLQLGEPAKQLECLSGEHPIRDFTSDIKDLADTAALIANLDLVISIDTSVIHLAGALGKPVWALLPYVSDWRWLRGRNDSPWYPTMRLFRQPSPGDWQSPIKEMMNLLQGE